MIYTLSASAMLTLLFRTITFSKVTNLLLFEVFIGVLPYVISNEKQRKEKERIFSEITLFIHHVMMLLKQTSNVYLSLQRTMNDVSDPIRSDIQQVLVLLEEDQKKTEEKLRELEEKYPYSCIRNFNAIVLYMHYENQHINSQVLDTFQMDMEELTKDMKRNRDKRNTLRFQYIFITIGSLFSYWFLLSQLKDSFTSFFYSFSFRFINGCYIFTTLFILLIVNRYFNQNITKE